jgi:hypothetical protein
MKIIEQNRREWVSDRFKIIAMLVSIGFLIIVLLTGGRFEYMMEDLFGWNYHDIPLIGYDTTYMIGGSNRNFVRDMDSVVVVIWGTGLVTMQRMELMIDELTRMGFRNVTLYRDTDYEYLYESTYTDIEDGNVYFNSGKLLNYLDSVYGNGSNLVIGLFTDYSFGLSMNGNETIGISRRKSLCMYNHVDDGTFRQVFWHEVFHSFGMMHCGDIRCLMYPTVNSNLKSYSVWDHNENRFIRDTIRDSHNNISDGIGLCSGHYSLYCTLFGTLNGGLICASDSTSVSHKDYSYELDDYWFDRGVWWE